MVKENDDPDATVWVGAALESALRARAPGVHDSTPLVRQLAVKVAQELGLDAQSRSLLDLCVRVRDVGMIALPDEVVLATTPLSPEGWELMNRHPVVGAQLLDELFGELVESMKQMNEIVRGKRAPSRRFVVDATSVKKLRSKLGLSQPKFAALLHVDVGTLRNWEQGRREPTGPAKALLTAISRDPVGVLKALAA